ncbi:helix-turn-helix domain-containing protein [Cuneatibacter sp. NSJ-177]|uniref:helix-turn-helix domain-containing protein n=1 Tax=Cuneatibacter sp. NSJ-177 TaxID=2931401 RepID=UPI001FD39416|nr:helix-turn-helix transcriptional regulator [Cuneatibacter sp. NSJ-177]MCJ7837478.1 helix-turn-helix domain-containing protein [Cuneatibacter sp. NSJ-177]
MSSVDKVKVLCKEKKIPISKLEKELGFSNGYIGQLKKGVFPDDRLKKIADYLGVSIDYLTTGDKNIIHSGLTAKDEKDIKKDLDNIMEKISTGADGPASYDGEELSPESLELFRGELEIALKRLKLINKEKYNPHKNKK